MKNKNFENPINVTNVFWVSLFFIQSLVPSDKINCLLNFFHDYFLQPWSSLIGLIILGIWFFRSPFNLKCHIVKWSTPLVFWALSGLRHAALWQIEVAATLFFVALYLTFVLTILLHLCIVKFSNKCKKAVINQGLISDDPIESDEENDSFGRKDYAKSIVSEIRKTVNKRAFNIAVTGAWGSGKTSFLNLIKGEMDKTNNNEKVKFIPVKYNPWDFKEDKIIGLDLLKTISHKLANEKELQEKFKGLMTSLQGVDQSPWYKVIPYFLSGFSADKSINEYREEIGKALQEQNKKLVIFLDDLDRLDGDEILEVFKTIRNSFDIANTFFILGFDIDYVVDQIEDKVKGERALQYLDKIFQMRLNMPSNVDFDYVRLLKKETGQDLDIRIPRLFYEIFSKLDVRTIFSIVNGIKLFEHSSEKNKDFDFSAKVLLQIISLKYPKIYKYLSENYSEVMNDTVKQEIFKGQIKPNIYYPQSLEKVRIADYNNEKKKLILYLLYLMTPYNSINLSESIYYSYFKFKTPDHLISRTGLYVAIGNCDQDFIDKHIGTIKETDIFRNLELSAKDYESLDDDQLDFILTNLIDYYKRLIYSSHSYKELLNTNLYPANHNTTLENVSIFNKKSFNDYLDKYDNDIKFKLNSRFWMHLNNDYSSLKKYFENEVNSGNTESGYICRLLYWEMWPLKNNYTYSNEQIEAINSFKEEIKGIFNEGITNNILNFIKPFITGLGNKFAFDSRIVPISNITGNLNLKNEKENYVFNWLNDNDFNNPDNFYTFDYKLVFEEEYDSILGKFSQFVI